ncbi:hypothetical protein HDU93_007381, partial [Gonapodya sp. JEL0774]
HWQTAIFPSPTAPPDPKPTNEVVPIETVNIPADRSDISEDVAPKTTKFSLAKLPELWEIKEADVFFSVTDVLGGGGYGTVYRGKWLKDIDVAVKVVSFAKGYDMKYFDDEATTWYNLTSEHVLPLYGIVRRGNMFAFVSPILEYGSVPNYLRRFSQDETVRRKEVLWLLLDIARGLEYLHSLDIVHANVSPDYALVDRRKHAVLTDFGTSKFLSAATFDATGGRVGKVRYMSPERMRGEGTTTADDVYAFGMVIYSKEPFGELPTMQFYAILHQICDHPHIRPYIPADANMPVELETVMKECWDRDPTKRPPFTSITRILSQITPERPPAEIDSVPEADLIGDADYLWTLADGFHHGRQGREQNLDKASQVYLRAAEFGHVQAMHQLYYFYKNGLGILPKNLESAFTWCQRAVEQGNDSAQLDLGDCFYFGQGHAEDHKEAAKWYRKLADQGHSDGQFNLGVIYLNGHGVQKDEAEAVKWFRRAADQSNASAQYGLGMMYANGQGVPKDHGEAVKWFGKAAEQGYADAQNGLGFMYENGQGVQKEEEEAVKWYRRAAEQGNRAAQFALGLIYSYGKGVQKNEAEAVKWYRKAADQGNAPAQFNLGYLYDNGQGVQKDEGEALEWYRRAADQGNARAQSNLGVMFTDGRGVEKDEAEAVKWYRRAADQGNMDAQFNLGLMYANGRGVEEDVVEAVKWFRKAADQGDEQGQFNLGFIYENGRGVQKDEVQALMWYRRALNHGNSLARSNHGAMYNTCRSAVASNLHSVRPMATDILIDEAESAVMSGFGNFPDFWEIKVSDLVWSVDDTLGGGGYGTVYRGKWLNNIDVAVKVVRFAKGYDMKSFEDEATTWHNLTSPHVLPLYGIMRQRKICAFVSPIIKYGSVRDYLDLEQFRQDESLRQSEVLLLLLDIARGLEYLHSLNIVHGDVSPDNALVDKCKHAVLTDFGASKILSATVLAATGDRPGKLRYMSPERMRSEGTTKADDVYAFGMVIYSFFATLHTIWGYPHDRPKVPADANMHAELETLMRQCWDPNPTLRPTFSSITSTLSKITEKREPDGIEAVPHADLISDADYLWTLADCFHHGRDGQEQNFDKASQVYLRAAEFRHVRAMHQLYYFYNKGLGILPKNSEYALTWCQHAAEQGYAAAQSDLGTFLYTTGNRTEAVEWFRKAANQGDAFAQVTLGLMSKNGESAQKDEVEAVKWFRKAANQGDVTAQNNLGLMYVSGRGGAGYVHEARKLFTAAGEQGDAWAQFNLAYFFHLHGLGGCERDVGMAEELLTRSGDGELTFALGILHEHGWGGRAKDDRKAVEYYLKDLRCGAKTLLAAMYEDGRGGLDQDLGTAVRLYTKSLDEGT